VATGGHHWKIDQAAGWSMDRGRGGGEGVRIRDHLANTRTLLSWLRVALALLGLGFVVARLQLLMGVRGSPVGPLVAASGVVVVGASALRFVLQRREIEGPGFAPRYWRDLVVAGLAAAGGLAVLVYVGLAR